MKTTAARPIEDCLLDLFRHLGVEQAHIAAGGPPPLKDWHSLATLHPERVASLTVISPPVVDPAPLAGLASRMLVVAGDQGPHARGAAELMTRLPNVSAHILRGYEWWPWTDVITDRGAEIGAAMLDCLDRHPLPAIRLSEAEGEVAWISYRIRGTGPPLVLMPLSLAPSQWDSLIATLSARYCTLSLGGPLLGVVGNVLEERGRSNYMAVVKARAATRQQEGEQHGGEHRDREFVRADGLISARVGHSLTRICCRRVNGSVVVAKTKALCPKSNGASQRWIARWWFGQTSTRFPSTSSPPRLSQRT